MMLTVLAVVALALVVFSGSSENNPPEEIINHCKKILTIQPL
jgi:hypothetical protein